MKGYKGFNPDMTCRDKQYAENTIYEENNAEICKSGMHFCKNPFEVLNYYLFVNSNAEINEFAEVEALDECKTDDNEKFTTKKLKIGAKIGIDGLIKAFVKFTLSKVKTESVATNTGYCSVATNTGYCSVTTNTGDCSVATNTGNCSLATNTGYCSVATNTGYCSVATNTGNRSVATNTGYCSVTTNTGDCSVATNTGYCSVATVSGKSSIAIATGEKSKAKGALECYIALAEWKNGELVNFRAHKVDGKIIKPDTFYVLKNGKFVEVKNNEN